MKSAFAVVMACSLTWCAALSAQEVPPAGMPVAIELPGTFHGESYIFPADMALPAPFNKIPRFTPTADDIKEAERIFAAEYQHLVNDNTVPGEYYARFVRQYIGYIAPNGERKILIQLVNNKKPHKTRKLLGKDWEERFINLSTADVTAIAAFFVANLDSGKLNSEL